MEPLTQSEMEWLRCLTISRKLVPVLPDTIRRKFEHARLVEAKAGRHVITERGSALLRQRSQPNSAEK
jgi:hypothetical protein